MRCCCSSSASILPLRRGFKLWWAAYILNPTCGKPEPVSYEARGPLGRNLRATKPLPRTHSRTTSSATA
jgi:hypothetical protein